MNCNNFDFLRLLFASFVIITHSYSLTGLGEVDWLYHLSDGQTVFSYLGVRGFFVISGYLIYNSLTRSNTLSEYYYKRMLRLYPGLFVALHLTLLLSFFVFAGSATDFISNRSAWTYIPNNLTLFKLQYKIDGVFENNPYSGFINGSLWTISYELFCYLALSILYFIKRKWHASLLLTGFITFVISRIYFFDSIKDFSYYVISLQSVDLFAYFSAGSLLAAINIENVLYRGWIFTIAVFVFVLSFFFGLFYALQFVTFPIIVLLFGIASTNGINTIGKRLGDVSYGIYIYGFIIQQTLMHFFRLNFLELMVWSLCLSLIFGYLSWHLVEKKALLAKNITKEEVFNKVRLILINEKKA